jgi:hypothetical protein
MVDHEHDFYPLSFTVDQCRGCGELRFFSKFDDPPYSGHRNPPYSGHRKEKSAWRKLRERLAWRSQTIG